jgi:hypothetical protein
MKLRLLAGMAMLFETVAAHGGVMRYQIDGKSYEGYVSLLADAE